MLDRVEDLAAPNRDAMRARRDALIGALRDVGQACETPKAGMYLWLSLPPGLESSRFAGELLDEEGLAVLAGSAFGAAGEGFVRLSFIVGPDRLREAALRIGRALNGAIGARS